VTLGFFPPSLWFRKGLEHVWSIYLFLYSGGLRGLQVNSVLTKAAIFNLWVRTVLGGEWY
jgi:hypothetical protein